MDYINRAASALNNSFDATVDYLQENAYPIACLLVVAYILRAKVFGKNKYYTTPSVTLRTSNTNTTTTKKTTTESHTDHLRQVRLRQQTLQDERAKEAAKRFKEQERREKERKNDIAKKKWERGGDTLGSGGSSTTNSSDVCSYNPMQPWTGGSSGYRPARRSVRRG